MYNNQKCNWLREAGWGVFCHYLAAPASSTHCSELTPEQWNRRIDNFQAGKLAEQLAEAGAAYLVMTLGQNSGFFLSPNPVYDEIVGRIPSRCSRRDLIADLYHALEPYGIRLMVYIPSNAPIHDPKALKAFEFSPIWQDRDPEWCGLEVGDLPTIPGVDSRMSGFQHKWEKVIAEWSLRWGNNVHGWWVDGCYHPDLMYDFPDEPNFASFKTALTAGNPNSITAFALRCSSFPPAVSDYCDYTAGEFNNLLPVPGAIKNGMIKHCQYHVLTYMGENWGCGKVRFSADFVKSWTRLIMAEKGVVSWDIPVTKQGVITTEYIEVLRTINS